MEAAADDLVSSPSLRKAIVAASEGHLLDPDPPGRPVTGAVHAVATWNRDFFIDELGAEPDAVVREALGQARQQGSRAGTTHRRGTRRRSPAEPGHRRQAVDGADGHRDARSPRPDALAAGGATSAWRTADPFRPGGRERPLAVRDRSSQGRQPADRRAGADRADGQGREADRQPAPPLRCVPQRPLASQRLDVGRDGRRGERCRSASDAQRAPPRGQRHARGPHDRGHRPPVAAGRVLGVARSVVGCGRVGGVP